MDELLQQIERLAAANQDLTQRLDREHSMRLADSERYEAEYALEHAGRKAAELRAHEAEAALEALRADVERDRTIDERDRALETIEEVATILGCESEWTSLHSHHLCVAELASSSVASRAVASVCELLAAWGRLMDRNDARGAIAEARAAALLDAKDAASGAIGSLVWGDR